MNFKIRSLFLLLSIFTSCTSNKQENENVCSDSISTNTVETPVAAKDSFATEKIISDVKCLNDPSKSFALFLPASYSENKEFPVMFFFDSHGDGSYPLTKYSKIATELNFILVGSNNSKNGNDWATTQSIWNSISTDVRGRLHISEKKIYTCGFSGGAKVACYIAMNNGGIKGVIANSAGFPEQQSGTSNLFDFIGLAGTGDMNMTDLVTLDKQLSQTKMRHQLILFEGKHEWAPLNVMRDAFLFHEFNGMKDGTFEKNEKLVQVYYNDKKKEVEKLVEQKQFVKALQISANAYSNCTGLIADVNWMKSNADKISSDAGFQNQLKTQQDLLMREQNLKESFQQLLSNPDPATWQKIINDLNSKSKGATAEAAMYQRIVAYLSLACYSLSNCLIINNDLQRAGQYVTLYKIVDPANSEAWYFSAIINARFKQPNMIYSDLKKAIELGFTDVTRMQNQVDFQPYGTQVNFQELEGMISK